jgi:hypothetical protein
MTKLAFAVIGASMAALACSNPATPTPQSARTPRSVAVAAGGEANALWFTVVSPDERGAAETALRLCSERSASTCTFNVVCSGPSGAWVGLTRSLVAGVYEYQLTCDGISAEQVTSHFACSGCEVLWGPTSLR